jgi:predicted dehydrogenase
MTAPLKVGVIGVGYLGRFHAEKYAALPEAELVGVVDIVAERGQAVGKALNAEAFTDYRHLLPLVEAVSVAATTSEHYRIVRDCLMAGRHVLVEKPIAASVDQAQELVDLSREKGCRLMVGHLERFNSAMEELKRLTTQPRFIETHRLAFFKERGTDVDVVLDLMIHDLDHILSLVTGPVVEIRAAGIAVLTSNVDIANVRLEFGDGCIANLTASRMSLKSMRRFRVFQPEAYMAIDFEAQELTVAARKEGAMGPIPGVALELRRFPKEDVLLKEIYAFVTALQQGQEAPITGEAGLAALRLAMDINTSMRKAKV